MIETQPAQQIEGLCAVWQGRVGLPDIAGTALEHRRLLHPALAEEGLHQAASHGGWHSLVVAEQALGGIAGVATEQLVAAVARQ